MVKIEIRTENVGGDEELTEALREIASRVEDGEVTGLFFRGGETYAFAVNPEGGTILENPE